VHAFPVLPPGPIPLLVYQYVDLCPLTRILLLSAMIGTPLWYSIAISMNFFLTVLNTPFLLPPVKCYVINVISVAGPWIHLNSEITLHNARAAPFEPSRLPLNLIRSTLFQFQDERRWSVGVLRWRRQRSGGGQPLSLLGRCLRRADDHFMGGGGGAYKAQTLISIVIHDSCMATITVARW
jgi:hypothetical protein